MTLAGLAVRNTVCCRPIVEHVSNKHLTTICRQDFVWPFSPLSVGLMVLQRLCGVVYDAALDAQWEGCFSEPSFTLGGLTVCL